MSKTVTEEAYFRATNRKYIKQGYNYKYKH